MKRLAIVFWLFSLIMVSCKYGDRHDLRDDDSREDSIDTAEVAIADTVEYQVEELPMPVTADELFDDFFFNFASNKPLQMSRIVFPLKVSEGDSIALLSRKDWQMESFFVEQGYYTLVFDSEEAMEKGKDTSVDSVVVEKIMFDTQTVRNYNFSRSHGTWMLRSVSDMRMVDNSNFSFLDFYNKFSTDSLYQMGHLNSTVYFETTDPDDELARMDGIITSEMWPAFAPELPCGTLFNVVYGKVDASSATKIFVIRGISNGLETELTFINDRGRWLLTKIIT